MSWPRIMCSQVRYFKISRTVTRNALNKSVWRKKDCFWHTMNIFIQISNSPRTRARFSENQSAPRLENRKTSPCSPCAPNLLHVLISRIPGYHNLCSPGWALIEGWTYSWWWLLVSSLFTIFNIQRLFAQYFLKTLISPSTCSIHLMSLIVCN